MEFSTKVNIAKPAFSISHQDKILMTGSCFTENIGLFLQYYGFKVNRNPFGIIYNPISIFNGLNNIINPKEYLSEDLTKGNNNLFFSYDHHGSFSHNDKESALKKINEQINDANIFFKNTKFVFITLGTSFVYHHIKQNRIVANCHKVPGTEFEKRLLTINDIISSYNIIKPKLKDKIILFTVSPVRHWRDGAVENQRSKSILHESIHQIISQNQNCFYFPAYEIMMDELRDYRYYTEDMLHPNTVAVKYIWQQFSETYFNDKTQEINKIITKGRLMHEHRVKHVETEVENNFEKHKLEFRNEFKTKFPDIEIDF